MKAESALIKTFVDFCELDFEERMNHVCRKIIRKKEIEIVTLSGPTCSGKTTMAKKLISYFTNKDLRAYCISIDNYFYDRRDDGPIADMDSVKAIDLGLLAGNIRDFKNKSQTEIPSFDFISGRRLGYRIIDPCDYDLFVFEGIQAIYPEVVELFGAYDHAGIYISVSEDPVINGVKIDRRDIRLMRRLVRDFRFRGASAERTFDIWNRSVIPNEEANILPNIKNADIRISSYMPYEPFVLKLSLEAILSELPSSSEYRGKADEILYSLKDFESIKENFIPENSLYREFIG